MEKRFYYTNRTNQTDQAIISVVIEHRTYDRHNQTFHSHNSYLEGLPQGSASIAVNRMCEHGDMKLLGSGINGFLNAFY